MRGIKQRILSLVLAVVMIVGMLPTVAPAVIPEAEAAPASADFITLPITIRDFAADGMLFEFNQVGATGTYGATSATELSVYGINPSYSTWINDYNNGIHVVTYAGMTQTGPWGAGRGHFMAVCKADGTIVKVVPGGTAKGT